MAGFIGRLFCPHDFRVLVLPPIYSASKVLCLSILMGPQNGSGHRMGPPLWHFGSSPSPELPTSLCPLCRLLPVDLLTVQTLSGSWSHHAVLPSLRKRSRVCRWPPHPDTSVTPPDPQVRPLSTFQIDLPTGHSGCYSTGGFRSASGAPVCIPVICVPATSLSGLSECLCFRDPDFT